MDTSRQWGVTISVIRPDHVRRYELAAQYVHGRTLDAACGCGYGTSILYKTTDRVVGVDADAGAIEWARKHYPGPGYLQGRIEDVPWVGQFDSIVSLETIEHLPDPVLALDLFRRARASTLIVSVPNEERYPFRAENFERDDYPHYRHYTPAEIEALLAAFGFQVKERFCQKDKQGEIHPGTDGMFLIYVCGRQQADPARP